MADKSNRVKRGDIFIARVVNQKAVNQSAQQVLVAVAAQVLNLIEAQFGVAVNDDEDTIDHR
ncbi:MAG: hypothetical protein MJB12_18800 [Firmicutes bacterium]|nr:hypothetical protein [Bacillota bacterium]